MTANVTKLGDRVPRNQRKNEAPELSQSEQLEQLAAELVGSNEQVALNLDLDPGTDALQTAAIKNRLVQEFHELRKWILLYEAVKEGEKVEQLKAEQQKKLQMILLIQEGRL
jgi:hypothetical protein